MRRLWLLLLGLVLSFGLAHATYWYFAVRALEDGFAQWAAERRAAGWTVASGAPSRGGWPFEATLTLHGAAVAGGTAIVPGGFAWSGERLTLRLSLFNPHRLELVPEGAQHVRLADSPEMPLAAERIVVTLPVESGIVPHVADLTASGLRLTPPLPTSPPRPLEATSVRLHADWRDGAPAGEPALALLLDAADITLPPGARWALGNRISALSLDGALTGPAMPMPDPRAQLRAWREGGGKAEIRRLAFGWGPLGVAASGTLTLDDQLQPTGTANAALLGYAEAADMLATTGVLTRSAATAVKALLGLLAGAPSGGVPGEVDVPLTLQDRTLAMSRIPLMRVPVVSWPAASP